MKEKSKKESYNTYIITWQLNAINCEATKNKSNYFLSSQITD
jgi:hypothetical protein